MSSTRIYLSQTVFNNDSLPRGTAFNIDNVLRFGFVGGFRPAQSLSKTADLSGRRGTVFSKGSPEFDQVSVISEGNASGLLTTIEETRDITMIATFRPVQQLAGVWGGYYFNACATYADNRNSHAGGTRGIGPFMFFLLNSGTNLMELILCSQFSFYNASTETYGSANVRKVVAISNDTTQSGIAQEAVPWIWCATRIEGNSFKVVAPGLGWSDSRAYTDAHAYQIHNRLLAAQDTGTPNMVPIGTSMANYNWPGLGGQMAVAEVLVFNRALSDTEINDQYSLSKSWLLKNRGIGV